MPSEESGARTPRVEDDTEEYRQPTPWYRSEAGETVLSVVGVLLALACWHVVTVLSAPQPLVDAVATVGVAGMLAAMLFSGRAATKAVGRVFNSD
jgi:hypothetical protein